MKVATFRDVMGGHGKAEIVCAVTGNVVRTLTVKDGMVHLACPNGDSIDVPEATPVVYQPWVFDRGSLIFGHGLKLATEMDKVRYPDGTEDTLMPDIPPLRSEGGDGSFGQYAQRVLDSIEPSEPVDDGGCDPLYGRRMDSADMGEN